MNSAREFLNFWITNCVHASEQYGSVGAIQDVSILVDRCETAAGDEGFTKSDLEAEVGDLRTYLKSNLKSANELEGARRDHHQAK